MTADSKTIFPCPLSKGYGIPTQQAWLLLKVYLSYRFILAGLFVILFYSHVGPSLLGSHDRQLYNFSAFSYLGLCFFSAICIIWRLTGYVAQAQTLIVTDIIVLTLLMHACGGISSGLGVLIGLAIAAAGLLIGGRCAMFFAAIASLAVLAEQIYADYFNNFGNTSYTYAGMLGASFFTIALLSYILAQRSEQSIELAAQQQQTISQLEELNNYIIQHLQSGIIITNLKQTIQMANEAALKLANLPLLPVTLSDISEYLSLAMEHWLADPQQDFVLLQLPNQADIHVRFMQLPTQHEAFFLVIFEDIALYNQRLQQSKLASLGRLTASIAHEIRNPLSAISHAGQLLSENTTLPALDRRLTEIIQTHSLRVNHIIEDILKLSRRNHSIREKIQLKPWLLQYLDNFLLEHNAEADCFHLTFNDDNLEARIDPSHLKQILDNLCLNAIKYGGQQKPIQLHTCLRRLAPCIEVIDKGPGLIQEQINHLFEPFFTTSPTGTGLGLYISKELAELNQATLSYHLTDDNYSCFRLCLMNAEHSLIEI
ncbi:MAG: ATP-binding protein [Methylococcaceae bacterium]|jgi:two-component system sensor histidine kinase PilS (NtrC family)